MQAKPIPAVAPDYVPEKAIRMIYKNHRGEVAERHIVPFGIAFGSTQWHPHAQLLLRAFDIDKQADREFALKDCDFTRQIIPGISVEVSLHGKKLATAQCVNVSECADISNFEAHITEEAAPHLGIEEAARSFPILDHDRHQTVWALVREIAVGAVRKRTGGEL